MERRVQVLNDPNGNGPTAIRFEGAGLDALANSGESIGSTTVLAYIELQLKDGINDLIKQQRTADQYGAATIDPLDFLNHENFNVALHFSMDANVDHVVFSDLVSLRDVGGPDLLIHPSLDVNARAAQADLVTTSSFDLGTHLEITKPAVGNQPAEGAITNLIRSGDTIFQHSTWQNSGEFTLSDLHIDNISSHAATVTSTFDATGSSSLASLDWSDQPGAGASATITSKFDVIGAAGSVLDTCDAGFTISALGDYSWNTTKIDAFCTSHLITYQADINYDGAVTMKDLASLNAGAVAARNGSTPHDVDVNYDGAIDIEDLAMVDAQWGKSLHSPDGLHAVDGQFLGSDTISMDELFHQNGRTWDSSAFQLQNQIEAGSLPASVDGPQPNYVNVLTDASPGLISNVQGTDNLPADPFAASQPQYALTSV